MKIERYYTQEEAGEITRGIRISGITGVLELISFWAVSILTYAFISLVLGLTVLFFLSLLPFIALAGIVYGMWKLSAWITNWIWL